MRKTRILAGSSYNRTDISGDERLEMNRWLMLECLDRAKDFQPDIVVFPEIALQGGAGRTPEILRKAETVPGPMFEAVAEKARALKSHVILPMLEKRGEKVYNSAVLIGRDGGHIGTYSKFHATGYEIEDGVAPGEDVPVWETDCGRIGCMICFDLEFDDVAVALARGKANIVFWPTMFTGGQRVPAWAISYGFFMVKCGGGYGEIVDPMGRTVAKNGPVVRLGDRHGEVRWTCAEVNTDFKMYHPDFNHDNLAKIVERFGGGVQIQFADPEGRFTITSNMPDVTAEDIEKEYGLTDLRDYIDGADLIRKNHL